MLVQITHRATVSCRSLILKRRRFRHLFGEEAMAHFFQSQSLQHFLQTLGRTLARQVFVAGDDQFIFHRMLPAHQLRHVDLIAMRFELKAAQHVGDLAAEFARVQRMAPDFGQRVFRQRLALVLLRTDATSAWQHGTSTMKRAFFFNAKWIASSVAVLQAWSAVTMSICSGSSVDLVDSATDNGRKDMPGKLNFFASSCDFATSSSRVSMP